MPFSLPALPYDYSALEPYIDEMTMKIHHDKHHQAYIDKLNAAIELAPELKEYTDVDELLLHFSSVPETVKTAVRNHAGGHSNHSHFWKLLSPKHQEPSSSIKSTLEKAFGDWEKFVEKFNTTATNQFGSGWAWLVKNKQGELEIKGFPNQDSPLLEASTPVLGVDVWEHAYYLKYQNRRPDYIAAFWNIINWEEVEKRLS